MRDFEMAKLLTPDNAGNYFQFPFYLIPVRQIQPVHFLLEALEAPDQKTEGE